MDNLIINALKDVLGPEKFEELMKALNNSMGTSVQDALMEASVVARKYLGIGGIHYHNVYKFECVGADGNVKWNDEVHNLVVNTGLLHTLDVVLRNQTQTATWYLGLTNATPVFAAANTMAAHAGWTDYTNYASATRPALTFNAAAANSIAGQQVSFAINSTGGTVGGAFITSDNVKAGTTGLLYGGNAFNGGNRVVSDGDTLNVDVTVNASST